MKTSPRKRKNNKEDFVSRIIVIFLRSFSINNYYNEKTQMEKHTISGSHLQTEMIYNFVSLIISTV